MKLWQIFAVGVATVIAIVLFPLYESWIAAVVAVAIVSAVAYGFVLSPSPDVFIVRSTQYWKDHDQRPHVEHDRLAVKIELYRLWLLFIPTFLALAFLIVAAARGTQWKFSLLDRMSTTYGYQDYIVLTACRILLVVVVGSLSMWLSERRVLRHAEACSAKSVSLKDGYVTFTFVNHRGEYFGGESFTIGILRPTVLASLVLYNAENPDLNKIGMGMLFHKLVIVGYGLTDLENAKLSQRVVVDAKT